MPANVHLDRPPSMGAILADTGMTYCHAVPVRGHGPHPDRRIADRPHDDRDDAWSLPPSCSPSHALYAGLTTLYLARKAAVRAVVRILRDAPSSTDFLIRERRRRPGWLIVRERRGIRLRVPPGHHRHRHRRAAPAGPIAVTRRARSRRSSRTPSPSSSVSENRLGRPSVAGGRYRPADGRLSSRVTNELTATMGWSVLGRMGLVVRVGVTHHAGCSGDDDGSASAQSELEIGPVLVDSELRGIVHRGSAGSLDDVR